MTGIQKSEILGKGDYCYALPFYGKKRPILIDLILHFDETFAAENYYSVNRVGETLFSEAYIPRMRGETGDVPVVYRIPPCSKDGVLTGAISPSATLRISNGLNRPCGRVKSVYRNVVEDQTEFICRFLPDGTHVL